MDFRRYGIAPYVAIGVAGAVIYAIVGIIIMFADGNWQFGQNCISDLGISENTAVAVLFNGSCIVCGVMIAFFGIGKILFESNLNKIAGIFIILGSVAMMFVGIFNIDLNKSVHDTSAAVFAGCFITGIVLATLADIMKKDMLVLVSGIAVAIIALLGLLLTNAGTAEIIGIASAIIWIVFQLIKYIRDGAFSGSDDAAV